MRYHIKGADSSTGIEIDMTFDAASEEAAREIARKRGWLIESIEAVGVDAAAENRQQFKSTTGVTAAAIEKNRIAAAVAPSYRALRTISEVLIAFGFLGYVGAALALVAALITAANGNGGGFAAGFSFLAFAIGSASAGLIYHALGELLKAIRDIARNSFK